MYDQQGYKPKSHLRFYIVLVTLVIGAIFLVVLLNNKGGFGLGTAAVTDIKGMIKDNVEANSLDSNSDDGVESNFLSWGNSDEQQNTKSTGTYSSVDTFGAGKKEVETSLSFSEIPTIRKQVRLSEVNLIFQDLNNDIYVNNDKLQLSNKGEISFDIQGFVGEMKLDNGFSVNGKAKKIEINGVALASDKDIKIAFSNINYQKLGIANVELRDVIFSKGDGKLELGGRLSYVLKQDALNIGAFKGSIDLDKSGEEVVLLEGITRGVVINGDLLNLDIK
ncbi:hypothetical protein HYX11_05085 [Candidatus Woesearchaeota archaeon]|nr:hypothetical protein [Candidatus Woesearchaeota archaeon]